MQTLIALNLGVLTGEDKQLTMTRVNLLHIGFEFIEHAVFRSEYHDWHILVD